MNTEDFLGKLTGVHRSGHGWQALCPTHDDRKASLSIAEGEDGRILVHCQAGCTVKAVCDALGLKLSDLFVQPRLRSSSRSVRKPGRNQRIVATYPYHDETGEVLFECVRYEPKDFRQRRPDPAAPGKFVWNLKGVRRVPYQLPKVIAALAAGRTIFIAEGEKDCDVLAQNGFCATCNPMGAGKWLSEHTEALRGAASVVVIADKDEAGRAHAGVVVTALRPVVSSLKLIELPDRDGKPVKDVADFFAAGGTVDELSALVDSEPECLAAYNHAKDDSRHCHEGDDVSASSRLVAIALEAMELFHAPDKIRYGRVRVGGHYEVWPLKGQDAREWLCGKYFTTTGNAVNSAALGDALNVLSCQARFKGACVETYMRVAPHQAGITIDLGDRDWRAVVVDENGWQVVDEHPVMFIRPSTMLALPEPDAKANADFSLLWKYLNVTERHRPLIGGWVLGSFHPHGPYPILALSGQQGSAKSFAVRLLRMVVDPSTVELPSAPKDERDLIVSAKSRRLLAFDNLSSMPASLADALCRVATGGGLSVRQLYSDGEEYAVAIKRPVVFNGIPDLLARGDLAERSIRVELCPIDEVARRDEDEILAAFRQDLPVIFAGLMNGLCACVRRYRQVKLSRRPRMADAARWITAGETALGFSEEDFLKAFFENQAESARMVIEASAIGGPLLALLNTCGSIKCSASDLLSRLNESVDHGVRHDPHWPKLAHNLSGALKRLAPAFKQIGFQVTDGRTGDARFIQISRPEKPASPASSASLSSASGDADDAGDAVPHTLPPKSSPENLVEELI